MESLFKLLFRATLIWLFYKLIGNAIKAGKKKIKAKIEYLIGDGLILCLYTFKRMKRERKL